MKFLITRWMLWLLVLAGLVTLTACETPESQSSVPWNRPQSWERQGIGGIGY